MILGGSVLSKAYLLGDMAGGPMSALALAPAFVAGMAIGRFDLTRMRTALSLVGSGTIMVIVSKVLGSAEQSKEDCATTAVPRCAARLHTDPAQRRRCLEHLRATLRMNGSAPEERKCPKL